MFNSPDKLKRTPPSVAVSMLWHNISAHFFVSLWL